MHHPLLPKNQFLKKRITCSTLTAALDDKVEKGCLKILKKIKF